MLATNKPELLKEKAVEPRLLYCYLDVETTGTVVGRHGIIQLSGKIEGAGIETMTFDFYCRPHMGLQISDQVLNWHGLTRETLAQYEDPLTTHGKFKAILADYVDPYNKIDKLHIVAFNARFDMDFLRDWFERCGDRFFGSWFWFPPIDVMSLAALVLREERARLKDFKLATVAAHMGLEVDASALHEALYDVNLMQELYKALLDRLGNYN